MHNFFKGLWLLPLMALALAGTPPVDQAKKVKKPATKQRVEKTHPEEHKHWSYEGDTGPSKWAELDPANAQCGIGQQQSPINISTTYSQQLDALKFNYQSSAIKVTHNGHSIQHDYESGSYLNIGDLKYQLVQFHFHTPSEESIAGRRAPMDIHFVHRNEAGELAVVALQIEVGGQDNPIIQQVWHDLPTTSGDTRSFAIQQYNAADLLPANLAYWTFMGSLTTPPCSEGVRWVVLKEPTLLSPQQIEQFRKLFKMNARPLQPLNQRAVLDSQ